MTKVIVDIRNFAKTPKHVLMRMQTGFIGLTILRAVGCYKWDNKPLISRKVTIFFMKAYKNLL